MELQLRMHEVSQVYQTRNQEFFKYAIVCTDEYIIASCFIGPLGYDFYSFNFTTGSWRKLLHRNLPDGFRHFTMLLLGNQLVIHGTRGTFDNGGEYNTFTGDITERPLIRFQCIGTLQTPAMHEHRIVADHTNRLYAITGWMITNWADATVHRLDEDTRTWTVLYQGDTQSMPWCYLQIKENFTVYYDMKIYVFPNHRNRTKSEFRSLTKFSLKTNTWTKVDLRPAQGPQPFFPVVHFTKHCSLAQCPVEPCNVYLTIGNIEESAWYLWRLNLTTLQWCKLRHCDVGADSLSWRASAITPSGELCAIRSVGFLDNCDVNFNVNTMYAIEVLRLYRILIRPPRLMDLSLDAAMALQQAHDPDWQPVRSIWDIVLSDQPTT